jgi:hypothetical protein
MARYLPPAGVDDFSRSDLAEELRQGWHDEVEGVIDQIRDPQRYGLASPLFYGQLADDSGVPDGDPQGIPWNGFPLRLDKWFADLGPGEADEVAHRAAEVVLRSSSVFNLHRKDASEEYIPLEIPFRIQDEYCEWHVERVGSRIERISLTCEPPEYCEFLARQDFDLLHQLYKELLHVPDLEADDLRWPHDVYELDRGAGEMVLRYRAGDYNPRNVWNTERGAVHLTHPVNSLFAEVVLASDGTIGWPVEVDPQGNLDEIELMCCAGRGGINRSSDPLILRGVFNFARRGNSVALANPIGLYMTPFALGGLLDPDENSVGADCLKFVRASSDGSRILRAEVAPSAAADYTLDQCMLDDNPLRFGGQIARRITMTLFGVAKRIPGRNARRVPRCPQFCCFHPEHPRFRGTFPVGQVASCDRVPADWWKVEAYDIPDVGLVEALAPEAVAGTAEGPGTRSVITTDTPPVKLVGRGFMADDAVYEIETEGF